MNEPTEPTEPKRTIEVDGEVWTLLEDGTLAGTPLSEQDSRAAWQVYRIMKAEHLARGLTPPGDPITACVRCAYGTVLSFYGGQKPHNGKLDS